MKIIKQIIKKILFYLIKSEKGKILILDTTPYSGSNTYAFYKYVVKNKLYVNIELVDVSKKVNKYKVLKSKFKSEIIITCHDAVKYNRNQKIIQFWHGIPLKCMALMDNSIGDSWNENEKKLYDSFDSIISTSRMYTTLLNSTIGQTINKYKITGYPRNDLLLSNNNYKKINKIIGTKNKKIAFFVPTFRMGHKDRIEGLNRNTNIFGFDEFQFNQFDRFLEENNILLITKLHPFEEEFYRKKMDEYDCKNILFLNSKQLRDNQIDLYEFLAYSDLLITDYSSVYFDYLLTQKPLLFLNSDIEQYRKVRGLLLEPYDFWTPGPKVTQQEAFQNEMLKLLKDETYYRNERQLILNIFHEYKDSKSCERVWNYINEEYLKSNK